jgi:hypothetical protein
LDQKKTTTLVSTAPERIGVGDVVSSSGGRGRRGGGAFGTSALPGRRKRGKRRAAKRGAVYRADMGDSTTVR